MLLVALTVPGVANAADPLYGVSVPSTPSRSDLNEVTGGGVQALRLEISASDAKQNGGSLDWSTIDAEIGQAADRGLEVVPYLTGSPKWTRSCRQARCPGAGRLTGRQEEWLRFVEGAVNRYGPDGSFWSDGSGRTAVPIRAWQLWDTANVRSQPRGYGALLEATYRTIKVADPDAVVVTGALSFAGLKGQARPTKFLRELLRSSGKHSFSAIAVRPLASSVDRAKSQVAEVRRVLSTSHGSQAIWVTSIGWASDRRSSRKMSVGPGGQESRLRRTMKTFSSDLGIDAVFWSRWRDGRSGCSWCRYSGLVNKAGESKPAWEAYQEFLDPDVVEPPPPPPPTLPRTFFGVAPESDQFTASDVALMQDAGVGAARMLINWQEVLPAAGDSYRWGAIDSEFEQLALQGIEPVPQLFGSPSVVSNVGDPATLSGWREFVAAAVGRYGPGGGFWDQFEQQHPGYAPQPPRVWQVYNEQNTWTYWPHGGPAVSGYAKLLHASASAIRERDPTAKIMLGGMLGNDNMNGIPSWEFLRQLYQLPGARNDFDIVALHPYNFSLDDVAWEIDKARETMTAQGDAATPVWVTELSWGSTYDDDDTKNSWWERDPAGQAKMLTSAWKMMIAMRTEWNLGGAFWYTWRDPSFPVCAFCGSAGLLQGNMIPKPSFAAFRNLTEAYPAG